MPCSPHRVARKILWRPDMMGGMGVYTRSISPVGSLRAPLSRLTPASACEVGRSIIDGKPARRRGHSCFAKTSWGNRCQVTEERGQYNRLLWPQEPLQFTNGAEERSGNQPRGTT